MGSPFYLLVELGGIGHPRQPRRLHSPCRSQARCMQLEIPAHPPPRGFNSLIVQTKKPPEGGFFVWWSWGELNPRPQALHRQFYILSCVVIFNLRPRQRANIAQASYLGFNEMLSNPTFHVSRVYDAAMVFKATHPTGEMVQRPAGLSS